MNSIQILRKLFDIHSVSKRIARERSMIRKKYSGRAKLNCLPHIGFIVYLLCMLAPKRMNMVLSISATFNG